jgi:hypothetical protein
MDINKGVSVNKTQFEDLGKTTNGEGEFSITSIKGTRVGGTFSRIHKCEEYLHTFPRENMQFTKFL